MGADCRRRLDAGTHARRSVLGERDFSHADLAFATTVVVSRCTYASLVCVRPIGIMLNVLYNDGAQEKDRQPTLPHFAVGRRPPSNKEDPVPRIAETRKIIQRWKTLPAEWSEEE